LFDSAALLSDAFVDVFKEFTDGYPKALREGQEGAK
jgi:hypothetical protein